MFPPLQGSLSTAFLLKYADVYRVWQDHGFDPPHESHQLPGLAL